jgi:cytochrome c oxidase assembly protein subunit 15
LTASRQFRVAARLGLATTVLMFALMVIGSIVRTTGSGLACPDWPLCEGRLIPRFESHVLIEWFHRLVALLVSALLVATTAWTLTRPAVRPRLGGLAVLAVALLAVQILLGALTVWKLLDPAIVGGHLGVALLLFCTMLTLTLIARAEAADPPVVTVARPAGLLPLLGLTAVAAYGQCVLGGIVASHHAGLVCPDWPTCNGEWFPPLEGLVGLQMLHRFGAYTLALLVVVSAIGSRVAPDSGVRAGAAAALGLTIAQVVLGVANVYLGTPPLLVAIHLASAIAIVAALVAIALRVAMLAPAARLVAREAR